MKNSSQPADLFRGTGGVAASMRGIGAFLFFIILLFSPFLASFADMSGTLVPVSDGSEDSVDWKNTAGTSCSGANCVAEVFETSGAQCGGISDGDTSYIESSVMGANQTFDISLGAVPDNATITQVDVTACVVRVGTSPPNNFQLRLCQNETCSNFGLDTGAAANYTATTSSFSGLSLTKSAATDVEVGIAITGTRDKFVRASSLSAIVTYTPYVPPSGDGGGGSQGGGVIPRKVSFSGRAYESGTVELLQKSFLDQVYKQSLPEPVTVSSGGFFSIVNSGLLGGHYLFALRPKDTEGGDPGFIFFDVDLQDQFSVKDILVPPTLKLESSVVVRNAPLRVSGYASPDTVVQIEESGYIIGEIMTPIGGRYGIDIPTDDLVPGIRYLRAWQKDVPLTGGGAESYFSLFRAFRVLEQEVSQGDLNRDSRIDIADWSIFLFRFVSLDETMKPSIDFNKDGDITIADLSIFLDTLSI